MYFDVSDDGMILLMQDDGFSFEMNSPGGQYHNEILDVLDSQLHMVCTLLKACDGFTLFVFSKF